MNADPAAMAGLTTREVRNGTRDGAPTKIAVARRTYSTDRADLWDAVTNPERIPRWFLPVSGDLRLGGSYQIERNAGGVVERCDEPESFAITWVYGEMTSWVAVTLTTTAGGTELELVHEAHVDPDMWGQFGPGAVGIGWDLALAVGLGVHVETGAPADPATGLAYPTTPPGITFVETAARDWADAAVAAGDEPSAAREAADRTIAAYTGAE